MDDKWFKQQQKRVGVTAEDIARKMGRDRSTVSHIYTGRIRMSLDWAKVFAEVLQVPLATVLEKAGVSDAPTAQQIVPGFAESDAAPWVAGPAMAEGGAVRSVASALGADRPGIDIWRVKGQAMALAGLLTGDYMLIDTHASERARPGDVVVAQIYNNATGSAVTVLRRFEPPVLVAASIDPADGRVHVVDGVNVVVRGKVIASWRM
mgnify:CR=1 FL=1